jgi:hypothetical protein
MTTLDTINPKFWINALRVNAHVTDCREKTQAIINAADYLERYIAQNAAPEAAPVDWRELASEAVYVGLCIGLDCAQTLAGLQENGTYRPRCDDGTPSNADARKDAEKIADIYRRGKAMLKEQSA